MGSHQPIRKTVTPEIPDKLYFRIGDVAKLCEVPAYVLRFWETEFPSLKPNKGGTGQRLYRKRDVEMALRIKSLLYDQGYTIPGARQVFKAEAKARETPVETMPAPQPAAHADNQPMAPQPIAPHPADLRRDIQLQALRGDLRSLLGMLSKPVSPAHPSAAGKVKAMRPRLVLEPKPGTPAAIPLAPRLLQLEQRDLFGDERTDAPDPDIPA